LFELLDAGKIDLAFCQAPIADGPFVSTPLIEDPFVLLVATRSPLAAQDDPPPLASIARLPLVGFNESRAQDRVLERCRAEGIEPDFVFRSDLNATVQALVAADVGVAITPYLSVDPQHPGTTVFELSELPPRSIALVWHRDMELSRPAEEFANAVRVTCSRRFRH
jgi:DNA-binding transcriptional LysR family regulator